jgi:CDP-diacylglycerol---glycerol-3-phosphate 3-phosphatidyltransferase
MGDDVDIRHCAQVLATGKILTLNERTLAGATALALVPSFVRGFADGAGALELRGAIDGRTSPMSLARVMVSSTAPQFSRNWSLPNILTYARVAAVPLVAGFLFWPQEPWARWTALAIFVAAGISDFFDGYLARAWSQQSSLGRMLDPIADKLLVSAAILVLSANQTISGLSLWAAIVILCREILVSGLREHLAELRVPLPVTALAKWKTAVQFIAIAFLIAGPAGEAVLPGSIAIGTLLLWVAATLTLYTGWDYMKASYDHAGSD